MHFFSCFYSVAHSPGMAKLRNITVQKDFLDFFNLSIHLGKGYFYLKKWGFH